MYLDFIFWIIHGNGIRGRKRGWCMLWLKEVSYLLLEISRVLRDI